MKINSTFLRKKLRITMLMAGIILSALFVYAAPQDVDLTGASPNPKFTYNFSLNTEIPATSFGVLNASGNVFWEFNSTPPGATSTDGFSTNFSYHGITVTFPLGTPSSVANSLTATVIGKPNTAGSFSFRVQVADETNPALTRVREYEIIVAQPMDIVLVLDRSGSMGTTNSSGTRWSSLKTAVGNFGNFYQALNRTTDRISLTYFSTKVTPPSVCCAGLTAVNSTIGTTIGGDLPATPDGSTAMGLGLKDAIGKLSDPSNAKTVLIITDGEQNVNPLVTLDGLGFSDGTTIPGGSNPGDIKIFTIGIGSPSPDFHTTLQKLATNHRGSYNSTDDGSAFTFVPGDGTGSLSSGFTEEFVNILATFSPQIVERSSTALNNEGPTSLQSFPLNKRVSKLLLEFAFDRKFETPQLATLLGRISVKKDGTPVTSSVKPSWVGNYTNTILLTIDFENKSSPMNPEGDWTVDLANVGDLETNFCNLTTLADDHRLHLQRTIVNNTPKVNDSLPLSMNLDWLSYPVTDATIQAVIMRPGEDLGDFLATYPGKVDVSTAVDAGSPGLQKFEKLWATDSAFRAKLERTKNVVTLAHTANGKYNGKFTGLTVAGVYRILYLVSGNNPDVGKYKRILSESFYTSFASVDLSESSITTKITGDTLLMHIRPKTSYGKFVGPAAGAAFAVSDPTVKISKIVDNQDGSYEITFTGNINNNVTLNLLGQPIFTGKLEDAGKSGGNTIFNKWYIWLLLLLIILIVWLVMKKKK